MILPKRLMDLLRSRRFRIALAWSPFAVIILLALTWVGIDWYGRREFDRTMEQLVARGFPRTMEEAIGPLPRDEDNLLKNPTVITEAEASRELRANGSWMDGASLLECELRELGRPENSYFYSEAGREKARSLLKDLQPWEAPGRNLKQEMGRLRPAASTHNPDDSEEEIISPLFQAKMALDQHGTLCLAAGRKADALEDFLTALRFDAATQTTAVHCIHAEIGAKQFQDTVRAALMDPAAGTWTEDELMRFDEILKTACSGELTMKFQRMLPATLFELATRLRANPGMAPQRINWEQWRTDWQWEWPSAKESLKTAWRAVRPQGLRDVEAARGLEDLANKLGNPGTPTDWQVPLWETALFHGPAEEIAGTICADPDGPTGDLWNDSHSYSEGYEIEGAMWTALARWAIALERHRLRHGSHPASLAALDADLNGALPCDPLSKEDFTYRTRKDGGYELKGATPSWKKDRVYSWKREMEHE